MVYDITDHPLLGDLALALEPEVLEAQADVAELVLGLAETAYDGVMAERATTAVVLQVNYQLVVTPEVMVMSAQQEGERTENYRPALPEVYPPAARIVATLSETGSVVETADQWDSVVSVRTNRL